MQTKIQKRKVYKPIYFSPSSSISSEVLTTLTSSCFFSFFSSDQIGQLSFNANAKKSESSGSGLMDFASFKNWEYSYSFENFMVEFSNFSIKANCTSDNENLSIMSALCSLISIKENSGECNSSFGNIEISLAFDLSLKKENISGVSTTSSIYINPMCLSFPNLPFLSSFPSLINSGSLSCPAPFITSSTKIESNLRFSSDNISSFTSLSSLSASSSSSFGISTFNSAILSSQNTYKQSNYIKLSQKPRDSGNITSFDAPSRVRPANIIVASTIKSNYLNSGCSFLSFLCIPALTSFASCKAYE